MKTDKELLELAAKAAGIKFIEHCNRGIATKRNGPVLHGIWNPLADDGDALRLAVNLCISLQIDDSAKKVEAYYSETECTTCFYVEDFGADSLAATRRAIVRAAAAVGESK